MAGITVANLSKRFGSFTAVDNLCFDVPENHVVGFLGPNGAGKTTTLRMLVGLSKPTAGSITVADTSVVFGKSAANEKFGYLPELPQFYGWMTGAEFLNFVADLFKIDHKEKRIAELLKIVDLADAKDKKIATYSGGMKQRLGIAQALVNDPKVLIMDEPVSALDPIGRKEVLAVIERLKKNKTILFSTHILSDVDRICDDVILINAGKLVVASPLGELKAKYARPILTIEFVSSPEKLLSGIRKQKWVKQLEHNGNEVRVWTADGAVQTNEPMEYFAECGIGVLRYGLALPETEDLFMELLGGSHE